MTKLLILLLLPTIAHGKELVPKFFKGEKVKFETGFFYHKVCSGKGVIDQFRIQANEEQTANTLVYEINTPETEQFRGCPSTLTIYEKDIKAAE